MQYQGLCSRIFESSPLHFSDCSYESSQDMCSASDLLNRARTPVIGWTLETRSTEATGLERSSVCQALSHCLALTEQA